MAIIRIQNVSNFTVVSNDLINDPLLDWRDVGLLTFLLSKPDNWEVSTAHLQVQKKSGREAIHNSLRAIIEAGYATRKVSGKGGWLYEISNSPIYRLFCAEYGKAEYGKAEYGKAQYGKTQYGKAQYGKTATSKY